MDKEFLDYYSDVSDEELKNEVRDLINSKSYEPNNFTDMVKSIIGFNSISPNQRAVLLNHIYYIEYSR